MSCLLIGTKLFHMKNAFFLLLISLFLHSCKCEREEVGRDLLITENKEYLNTNKRIVEYYNQDNVIVKANFDGAKSVISEDREGPEVCSYITTEKGEENFVFGSYVGKIIYRNMALMVTLYNNDDNSVLFIQDFISGIYNSKLETVQINGFTFENVLVLDKNEHETPNGLVNKIIYSKTNGIEFILFEDGTWYKRVE